MAVAVGSDQRSDRLTEACTAALERLEASQVRGAGPDDMFAEVGEVLFWLVALIEHRGKQSEPSCRG